MSTSTVYQNATEQAWSTYITTSGRTSDYITLLQSHYDGFLAAAKTFDTVADVFKGTSTPSTTDLTTAANSCDTMSNSLTSLGQVVKTFPDMDATAINKAATLDQASLRKVYTTREGQDGDLVVSLNNVLYACQMLYAETKYKNLDSYLVQD